MIVREAHGMRTTHQAAHVSVRARFPSASIAMRAADHVSRRAPVHARVAHVRTQMVTAARLRRRLMRDTSLRMTLGAIAGTMAALVAAFVSGLEVAPHELALLAFFGSTFAGATVIVPVLLDEPA